MNQKVKMKPSYLKIAFLDAKVNIKMLESGQNNNVGKPTFLFCPY